jgi:hypothetical protein
MYKKLLGVAVLTLVLVGVSRPVFAAEVVSIDDSPKIAICHRDNDVKQPYGPKKITVNQNSLDGQGQNDHTTHIGPVATSEAVAQALKDANEKWGDIIPPFGSYPGLNWTTDGQAIWNNDCQFVVPVTPVVPPTDPGTVLGATTVAATPQVTTVPTSGVGAGAGGSAGSVVPALLAMSGSLLVVAYGVVRFRKFNG